MERLFIFITMVFVVGAQYNPEGVFGSSDISKESSESEALKCVSYHYLTCNNDQPECSKVEECAAGNDYCYSMWQSYDLEGETVNDMLLQGCWSTNSNLACSSSDRCQGADARYGFRFCCCQGKYCNSEVHDPE
ncbi:activin receptor type-2A-like isoform X2 [Saccoglossus kowalevskii]